MTNMIDARAIGYQDGQDTAEAHVRAAEEHAEHAETRQPGSVRLAAQAALARLCARGGETPDETLLSALGVEEACAVLGVPRVTGDLTDEARAALAAYNAGWFEAIADAARDWE